MERRRPLKIGAKIPDGKLIELTKGEHNALQKAILELFLPRFAPVSKVLYIGDASNKYLHIDAEGLEKLGLNQIAHDMLPDLVVLDLEACRERSDSIRVFPVLPRRCGDTCWTHGLAAPRNRRKSRKKQLQDSFFLQSIVLAFSQFNRLPMPRKFSSDFEGTPSFHWFFERSHLFYKFQQPPTGRVW